MNRYSFVFLFFCSQFFFSQKNNLNGWIVQPKLGVLQYEKENEFSSNAYSVSGIIGKEFQIGKKSSLVSGVKVESLYGNYKDYTFKSNFIELPLLFRYYFLPENNSTIFLSFGVENKFKIKENFKNIVLDTEYKGETGYHLGGIVEIGYKTKVSDSMDFLLGFNYSGDFANIGYETSAYKMLNGVSISFGIEVYDQKKN
ncbi:outer membrane beta-barrel protein [Chryseobacterium sp.]|uniref:outer membrane beta-barrel protein n=1 Tax=Chryseobacterium sp. TaxID=1871047 RepID=UPI002FC7875C